MKKIFISLMFLFSSFLMANESEALGRWITEKADNGNQIIVDIYKKENKYYGKIHQLTIRFDENGNYKKDINNPDSSKKERTLEGIDFVYDFTYNDSTNKYENGYIYDPSTGKTYSCYMELQKDGTLKVRGHIKGLPFLGRTQTWKRH